MRLTLGWHFALLLPICVPLLPAQAHPEAGHSQGSRSASTRPPTLPANLPSYDASHQVSGVIRNNGTGFAGLLAVWEAGFRKLQPGVTFQDSLLSGDAAIGGLEAGAADFAVNGREPVLTEFLSFAEVFGNDGPFQVTVATGSYEALGRTWAQVIFVNRDNPLAHLTMKQLDGIFGEARTGGYEGYKWTTRLGRPTSENIRTWGQLGLKGEWADKPIQTYGYAPTGMSNFFELTVFHGGTKWNPDLHQYVEASAKQATDRAGTTDQMMDDLGKDKYGIAWAGLAHAKGRADVKAIALGTTDAGPFLNCNEQTVLDRSYPLTRSIFIQMNRPPGTPIEPRLKDFLLYVLSREGQSAIAAQGEYLPLPTAELLRQRRSLE